MKIQVLEKAGVASWRNKLKRYTGFATDSHHTSMMWNYFSLGNQPCCEAGVKTELLDDDGSKEFGELFEQAKVSPVMAKE